MSSSRPTIKTNSYLHFLFSLPFSLNQSYRPLAWFGIFPRALEASVVILSSALQNTLEG